MFTFAGHPPVRPWSPRSQGFPRDRRLRSHGGPAPSRHYERRRPEKTPLHRVVSENLESWLSGEKPPSGPCRATSRTSSAAISSAASSASDSPVLAARAAARRLSWPSPARAAACVRPATVGTWRETAAHLVDHVIPPVPVRQWVISVPKRLRGMLADRPAAVAALTKNFLDEIERLLCAVGGVTEAANTPASARPRIGGISFLHRSGSALNHLHLHGLSRRRCLHTACRPSRQ